MAGRLVGNCDFNENPVVHLDFDFDLGFVKIIVQIYENTQKQAGAELGQAQPQLC